MPDLTPADVARLDQAHAAANTDLDRMITQHRRLLDPLGPTLACATLTAQLQTSDLDVDYLASMAAVAITRLAQEQP